MPASKPTYEELKAEVERAKEVSRLNALQASRADRRADAAEAKLDDLTRGLRKAIADEVQWVDSQIIRLLLEEVESAR